MAFELLVTLKTNITTITVLSYTKYSGLQNLTLTTLLTYLHFVYIILFTSPHRIVIVILQYYKNKQNKYIVNGHRRHVNYVLGAGTQGAGPLKARLGPGE